jgi:hypothetical protein
MAPEQPKRERGAYPEPGRGGILAAQASGATDGDNDVVVLIDARCMCPEQDSKARGAYLEPDIGAEEGAHSRADVGCRPRVRLAGTPHRQRRELRGGSRVRSPHQPGRELRGGSRVRSPHRRRRELRGGSRVRSPHQRRHEPRDGSSRTIRPTCPSTTVGPMVGRGSWPGTRAEPRPHLRASI